MIYYRLRHEMLHSVAEQDTFDADPLRRRQRDGLAVVFAASLSLHSIVRASHESLAAEEHIT
jgi:hypothetical protein